MLSCEFGKPFKFTFLTEHHRMSASAKFGSVCATKLAVALIAYHIISWIISFPVLFQTVLTLTIRVVKNM